MATETLDYILDGLGQWLEVERECGVRQLEVDRSLLTPPAKPSAEAAGRQPAVSRPPAPSAAPGAAPAPTPARSGRAAATDSFDLVFLHDRPLSPAGEEMMAKIVSAMGMTSETAPVVVDPPVPRARVYVVLGAGALRRHLQGVKGGPGQWVKTPGGRDALITYSPAFILRWPAVTDAVKEMKREMWRSLKGAMQRLNGGKDG